MACLCVCMSPLAVHFREVSWRFFHCALTDLWQAKICCCFFWTATSSPFLLVYFFRQVWIPQVVVSTTTTTTATLWLKNRKKLLQVFCTDSLRVCAGVSLSVLFQRIRSRSKWRQKGREHTHWQIFGLCSPDDSVSIQLSSLPPPVISNVLLHTMCVRLSQKTQNLWPIERPSPKLCTHSPVSLQLVTWSAPLLDLLSASRLIAV